MNIRNLLGINKGSNNSNPDIISYDVGRENFIPVALILSSILNDDQFCLTNYLDFADVFFKDKTQIISSIDISSIKKLEECYDNYKTPEQLVSEEEMKVRHQKLREKKGRPLEMREILSPVSKEDIRKIIKERYYVVPGHSETEALPLYVYGKKFSDILAGLSASKSSSYTDSQFINNTIFEKLYLSQLDALQYVLDSAGRAFQNKNFHVEDYCVRLDGYTPITYSYDVCNF